MTARLAVSFRIAVAGTLIAAGCDRGAELTNPGPLDAGTISHAASSSTTVVSIPASFTIRPSGMAAIQACVGETVTIGGNARFVAHETTLPDGSVVLENIHINPQGVVAVGDVSGISYRLVGGESNPVAFPAGGGVTATFEATLAAIGPGQSANFQAHILQHITITPNGDVTALTDVFGVDCT